MEYALIKAYEKELKDVKKRINKADKKRKNNPYKFKIRSIPATIILFFFLAAMFSGIIAEIVFICQYETGELPNCYWYILAGIIASLFVIAIVDKYTNISYKKENAEVYKARSHVLYRVVMTYYGEIAVEDKVEELITIFREKVEEEENKERGAKRIFGSAMCGVGGFIATSFLGIEQFHIGGNKFTFDIWLNVVTWATLIFLSIIGVCYTVFSLSGYSKKYRAMLLKLERLHIFLHDIIKKKELKDANDMNETGEEIIWDYPEDPKLWKNAGV